MEETPRQAAERIYIECYPTFYDNGLVAKKCVAKDYCRIVAKAIIKETLDEYTNDENHVRVEFWNQVLIEINDL